MNASTGIVLVAACLALSTVRAGEPLTISWAKKDDRGRLVHEVRSPYQAVPTQIRVLLPDQREQGEKFPAVYVLPVEPGTESRYGSGLTKVQKLGLHSRPSSR